MAAKTRKGYLSLFPAHWEVYRMDEILDRLKNNVVVKKEESYKQIGIRSHGKGIFYKEEVRGEELGNKSVFWIEPDCFIVNIVFAWEMAVAKTTSADVGLIASHRFPMYKPKSDLLDLDFLLYFFKMPLGKYLLGLASPGGAGRNKTLGQKEFAELEICIPPVNEQKEIVSILSTWDKAISLKEQLIEEKELQKKGLCKLLLFGKKRLNGFAEEWSNVRIKKLLSYQQPTAFITNDINSDNVKDIPVLTANKAFIKGYTKDTEGIYSDTPVVIFDDFTTSCRYVDFDFKIKSSAIKILKAKNGHNLKFLYERLKLVNIVNSDHKRRWISEFEPLKISIPSIKEQVAISEVLSVADNEITLLENELKKLVEQRRGLMQNLFSGKIDIKNTIKEV